MPDQAVIENNDGSNEPVVEEKEKPRKNPAVTKERIERLKKAFRSSWLQEMINSTDKNSSKK